MNPELPPLNFQAPEIRRRRRQRQGFPTYAQPTREERRVYAQRVIQQKTNVEREMSRLSPEQLRAIILKLRHDRPLKSSDLAGTDLKFLGEPGDRDSLVYPKGDNLTKLSQRAELYESGANAAITKNPGLISAVTEIEIADPKERLSLDMLADYESLIQQTFLVYEIEISSIKSSKDNTKRQETEGIIAEIISSLASGTHGRIYDTDFQVDGALLMVWTTGQKLQEWVENPSWWRKITRFELRPKFETMSQVLSGFNVGQITISPPPEDAETICVIDSGVAAGNPFLADVLKREESKSWVYGASPVEDACGHGSGVASLSAFHTISYDVGSENQASAWVVSARIMTDEGELDSPRIEDPNADRHQQAWLLSNILKEIVEHFVPLGVRIFVLAFEMRGHVWSHATRRQVARNAWIARTIDQLSFKHDVTFVGITGNLSSHEAHEICDEANLEYPHYLLNSYAKILDPGPSALSVVCGSVVHSNRITGGDHVLIAETDQPSPFTRTGPGFDNCIKPDVVEYGGSFVRDVYSDRFVENPGTSVVVASNTLTPALTRRVGTSYAAPRVANHLAIISKDIKSLGVEPSSSLLRAFLANSCSAVNLPEGLTKSDMLAIAGHGRPNGNGALLCRDHSVLLFWDGTVTIDSTAVFRIHVPSEISLAGWSKKRITVSVAAAPPVQRWGLGDYLGSQLKFWLYRGDKPITEIIAQHQRELDAPNTMPAGTTDHMDGKIGINLRSVGALQRDVFEWSEHRDEFSDHDYTLAVSVIGTTKWVKDENLEIPVAVVVRVEETSGVYQELYTRIRSRVRVKT